LLFNLLRRICIRNRQPAFVYAFLEMLKVIVAQGNGDVYRHIGSFAVSG